MPDDKAVKSSLELAMERFKKSDAEAGVTRQPLTDEQKAAIAEIRNFYEAKIAETELLHQSRMRSLFEAAERTTREEEYHRDRERLTSERDMKIEKVRRGEK
jgi:hypothetical protein